jgi:serine/threonine protein phosphatase 1
MPASHLRLLQRLELMAMIGDYAFVHAGIRPGADLERQLEEDLLWIRRGFVDAPGPFGKVIVHGHTWTEDGPQILEHRLGVDTGAYMTGVLTALRIEDGEVEVIQARKSG